MNHLGIDIAKRKFDVVLLQDTRQQSAQFENNPTGFARLQRWLKKRKADGCHVCMEATGNYWLDVAWFLHEQGYTVSVVNPKRIKRHAEATMQRNKTDRLDAWTIADFCRKHAPAAWKPPSPAYIELRALVRHRGALLSDLQRARNRLSAGVSSAYVETDLNDQIKQLQARIAEVEQRIRDHIDQHPDLKKKQDLLLTIPGIGPVASAAFIAEVPDVSAFKQASQLAAQAGLAPAVRESGDSVYGRGRLLKWGNTHLRAMFYMPAISAHRWNPIVAALHQRLTARGIVGKKRTVALMRKLLHLCYGVLKTGLPFDPNHASKSASAA